MPGPPSQPRVYQAEGRSLSHPFPSLLNPLLLSTSPADRVCLRPSASKPCRVEAHPYKRPHQQQEALTTANIVMRPAALARASPPLQLAPLPPAPFAPSAPSAPSAPPAPPAPSARSSLCRQIRFRPTRLHASGIRSHKHPLVLTPLVPPNLGSPNLFVGNSSETIQLKAVASGKLFLCSSGFNSCAPSETTNLGALEPLRLRHGAVIVGGGPAGLAAALGLAKLRRWTGITVVEKSHDVTWADPDRSFIYLIDGRGSRCADVLEIKEALEQAAIKYDVIELTFVQPDGSISKQRFKPDDPTQAGRWMPRPALMKVLAAAVEAHNASVATEEEQISILTSTTVLRLDRVPGMPGEDSGDRVGVVLKSREGHEVALHPSLVLGCDGVNSVVRQSLVDWAKEPAAGAGAAAAGGGGGVKGSPTQPGDDASEASGASDSAVQGAAPSRTFRLQKYPSPSSGLRFKVLRLPPNPVTRSGFVLHNPMFAILVGRYKGREIRLGLLPVKDIASERTGNVILEPDHPFWAIPPGDLEGLKAAFGEAFPQIDLDAQVEADVMQAFANAPGGAFPTPQASDGMAFVLAASLAEGSKVSADVSIGGNGFTGGAPGGIDPRRERCGGVRAAVVLAGDAAHAFPPDLGQGVNSALQDVQALLDCLARHDDDVEHAAAAYDRERSPEADALARLVQVGFPYQYQQAILPTLLSVLGLVSRLALSKVFGKYLIAPPIFFMVQDPTLKYGEILRRANETTVRISVGLVGTFVAIFMGILISSLAS